MPRRKKTNKRQFKNIGDVTINDFANSAVCKTRLKKSTTNVKQAIKQLEVDKSWDEKDFDSYDCVEEKNEEGEISYVYKQVRKRNYAEVAAAVKVLEGNDYPLDIWFLISDYIKPEDVGKFAQICKTSHAVTNTATFWFRLYKRHYQKVRKLPHRLQPRCVFRVYSIRTSVIRALHFMYPPFINRWKNVRIEEHPDVLKRRLCTSMWNVKSKDLWVYYFKLKEISSRRPYQSYACKKNVDIFELLEDIEANSEKKCRMLVITCKNYIHVEPVQGLFLTSVSVKLTGTLMHNTVHMGFSPTVGYARPTPDGCNSINIILDPVLNMKILDWWHPLYPHGHSMEFLMNRY